MFLSYYAWGVKPKASTVRSTEIRLRIKKYNLPQRTREIHEFAQSYAKSLKKLFN